MKSNVYVIPEYNIRFHIPENYGEWEIAEADNLPSDILFCGTCASRTICTMIIEPELKKSKINDLSMIEVEGVLHQILNQENGPYNIILDKRINKEKFNGKDAFHYEILSDIHIDQDNIVHINYCGYIFEKDNKILCIVITSPTDGFEELIDVQDILNGIDF